MFSPIFCLRRTKYRHALDIPGQANQLPLVARGLQPAHGELAKSHDGLDDSEHRLDRLLAQGIGEVIPRQLTWSTQETMVQEQAWYLTPDGRLDTEKLLACFVQFFRENSESWLQRYTYFEAGPQLLLQAFLQRMINGGGCIAREYGLGRGRTDLFLQWPLTEQGFTGAMQQVVLELKIQHKGKKAATLAAGLAQTARYADQCGADSAHLLIFNRDPVVPWDDKIYREAHTSSTRAVSVWGC